MSTVKKNLTYLVLALAFVGPTWPVRAQGEATGGWTYLVDAEHSGVTPEAMELPLNMVWKGQSGQTGTSISSPAVDDERAYYVAPSPATAAATGGTPLATTVAAPTANPFRGRAYTATPTNSTLYAVNRQTGVQAWKVDIGGAGYRGAGRG